MGLFRRAQHSKRRRPGYNDQLIEDLKLRYANGSIDLGELEAKVAHRLHHPLEATSSLQRFDQALREMYQGPIQLDHKALEPPTSSR